MYLVAAKFFHNDANQLPFRLGNKLFVDRSLMGTGNLVDQGCKGGSAVFARRGLVSFRKRDIGLEVRREIFGLQRVPLAEHDG